jgi:hypothetical protein
MLAARHAAPTTSNKVETPLHEHAAGQARLVRGGCRFKPSMRRTASTSIRDARAHAERISGFTLAALPGRRPSLAIAPGNARGVSVAGNLRSRFGAGVEPATLGLTVRCSTRLSYPVVDVPESNRRTRLAPLLDLSAIVTVATLSYILRHTPTAQPRAPDGPWNPSRWKHADECCVLPTSPSAIRCGENTATCWPLNIEIRFPHHSRRSIKAQRTCACRSYAPASAACATGCFRAEEHFRKSPSKTPFDACASLANAQNKTPPGMATRGRSRCLGRSG